MRTRTILPALMLALMPLFCQAQTKASASSVTVAKDGSGDFTTIQEAVNSLRSYRPEGRATIYLKPGVYEEKVTIHTHKTEISLIGEDPSKTIIVWHDHANMPDGKGSTIGTFETWTLRVDGPDFICENVTIANDAMTYHNPAWRSDHKNNANVGQAVALHIEGDRVIFRNCRLLGFQDTVFTGNADGRELFDSCYIEGTVDFLFGPATVWFEKCTINAVSRGYYTAASTPASHPYGYVFNKCTFTSDPDVKDELMGRPWRPYAYVLLKECDIQAKMNPAWWNNWGNPDNEKTARYLEYKCTGPGAAKEGRASWSREVSRKEAAKATMERVFHHDSDTWAPAQR